VATLLDPLRAIPPAVAALTPLQLIGVASLPLQSLRWGDVRVLREAAEAMDALSRAARADGVNAWPRSGYRTFNQQSYLWNRKFRGEDEVRAPDGSRSRLGADLSDEERARRILCYTAFPGTSRHHWGTDVDMAQTFADSCADAITGPPAAGNAPPGEPASAPSGAGTDKGATPCVESHHWMVENAPRFGFCRVYDADRGGFRPEPWHWSYLPLAVPALARYVEEVGPERLRGRGVDGESAVLDAFDAYRERFVLGIDPEALPGEAAAPTGEGAGGREAVRRA
jgi:LAS superfamily LD-carboxypeptidase LdcB